MSVECVRHEEPYNTRHAEETFLDSVAMNVANIQSANNRVDDQLCMDDVKCSVRPDTGADATVVSGDTYCRKFPHNVLLTSPTLLRVPDMKPFKTI